jgi:hypothetical protein
LPLKWRHQLLNKEQAATWQGRSAAWVKERLGQQGPVKQVVLQLQAHQLVSQLLPQITQQPLHKVMRMLPACNTLEDS